MFSRMSLGGRTLNAEGCARGRSKQSKPTRGQAGPHATTHRPLMRQSSATFFAPTPATLGGCALLACLGLWGELHGVAQAGLLTALGLTLLSVQVRSWLALGVAGAAAVAGWAASSDPTALALALRGIGLLGLCAAGRAVALAVAALERDRAHDPLTGVLNRRGFAEAAGRALAQARRSDEPVSVVAIDLDHFKRLNDTEGHARGDLLLTLLGQALSARRRSDLVARLGGDEFVVLLPHTTGAQAQHALLEYRRAVKAVWSAHGFSASFSAGVVTFPARDATLEQLLGAADAQLYRQKRARRGPSTDHTPRPVLAHG